MVGRVLLLAMLSAGLTPAVDRYRHGTTICVIPSFMAAALSAALKTQAGCHAPELFSSRTRHARFRSYLPEVAYRFPGTPTQSG